jgi:hypothetical protein
MVVMAMMAGFDALGRGGGGLRIGLQLRERLLRRGEIARSESFSERGEIAAHRGVWRRSGSAILQLFGEGSERLLRPGEVAGLKRAGELLHGLL